MDVGARHLGFWILGHPERVSVDRSPANFGPHLDGLKQCDALAATFPPKFSILDSSK